MTIDEAIKQENNLVDNHKKYAENNIVTQEFFAVIEYHKQLAEWLELLKWYQQGMEDIPSESGVLPKDVYRAGYYKAIQDFEDKIREICSSHSVGADSKNNNEPLYAHKDGTWHSLIDDVVEQLKEGSADNE